MKPLALRSIALVTVVAVAAALALTTGLGFWWVLGIVGIAVVANGLVATFEDDLPGGLNNPDRGSTPHYVVWVSWGVRAVGVLLLMAVGALVALHIVGAR